MRKPEIIDAEFEVITPATVDPGYPHLRQLWADIKGYAAAFTVAMVFYFPGKWLYGFFYGLVDRLF